MVEDIDFDMVYALHHFNATVEGQANAAKGEHMVLLDDSNSYWWLVRIVRDSSIGSFVPESSGHSLSPYPSLSFLCVLSSVCHFPTLDSISSAIAYMGHLVNLRIPSCRAYRDSDRAPCST
jgi:hypothetical protein